jgi:hypothetical protein
MYTAVRIVKMKACKKATRISKPVRPINTINGAQMIETKMFLAHKFSHSTANVTNKRWPASMLAKSLTASEKGRTKNVETNSITATRGSKAPGTPGGITVFLK